MWMLTGLLKAFSTLSRLLHGQKFTSINMAGPYDEVQ